MDYIYHRCSTNHQDFLQQQECIRAYLSKIGVCYDDLPAVVEKVSGRIEYTERKLNDLFSICKSGDIIYVSELSRLSRSMIDLFNISKKASDIGVKIIQCKDGLIVDSESTTGKMLLFVFGIAAEIQLNNIREQTKLGIEARKRLLEEQGYFISKSGRYCTRLGAENPVWSKEGCIASALAAKRRANEWYAGSKGYQWVCRQFEKGLTQKEILDKFNENFDLGIEGFTTREGKKMTKGVLHRWIQHYLSTPKDDKKPDSDSIFIC